MSKRSAFTLTELVVTMSAGSTLMILAIGMIHQTMSLAATARQRADNDRSINRLADQFRHDVHRAKQITVESPQSIQISLAVGGDVSYRMNIHRVVREQLVADGKHRETYPFTADLDVTFASQSEPTRAALTVVRETPLHGAAPRVDRHVEAVVGRLQRHESEEVTTP